MNIFYHPEVGNSQSVTKFGAEESRHFTKAMRLKVSDLLYVTNGKGELWEMQITKINADECEANAIKLVKQQSVNYQYCHLAVAPTKNPDRIEWLVEKAVEIGVTKISFVVTEHCESRGLKQDRINRLLIAALKQSQQLWLPEINWMVPYSKFVELVTDESLFIAHLANDKREELAGSVFPKTSTCILIGPEGDFSQAEIELASNKGFKAVALGNSRLRTETAALFACFEVARANTLG